MEQVLFAKFYEYLCFLSALCSEKMPSVQRKNEKPFDFGENGPKAPSNFGVTYLGALLPELR